MKYRFCLLVVLFFLLVPLAAVAQTDPAAGPAEVPAANSIWPAEYQQLTEWQVATNATAVPDGGLQLACEHATWTLHSGSLKAMHPTTDGRVTGYLFNGQGSFELFIPNQIEVEQLARFSGQPATETLQLTFTSMVLRTTQDLSATFPQAAAEGYEANHQLEEVQKDWLRSGRDDIDARIVAGLLTDGDGFLLAEMETEQLGRLTFRYEPWRREPVLLSRLDRAKDFQEDWVSLRHFDDSPGLSGDKRLDLRHIDAEINLTEHDGREYRPGYSTEGDSVHFTVTESFTPLVAGMSALQLQLRSSAEVQAVFLDDGTELPFLRAPIGKMFATIDNDIYDGSLVVVLPEPLPVGQEQRLRFVYTLKLYNYVSGYGWYPRLPESLHDKHTATLVFRHKKDFAVRAVGAQTGMITSGKVVTTTWKMQLPTVMIGFSFGEDYKEETLQLEGGPEVVVFGKASGATTGNMLHNVAVDLAKSLHFYQWYFDTKLPNERIYASRISSGHGQAFNGFIHLSHYTFDYETSGAAELFRSHEAAHQYWGHLVGWQSYRDQWLSEGLAEYSSMLFVEATMEKEKYFEEVLKVYFAEQLGSRGADMSRFARPWYQLEYQDVRDEVGPIGVGYRASTARVPYGYTVQAYNKGALVMHMLRVMLRNALGNDDGFRTILKDFLHTYAGKMATTADLAAVLSRQLGGDWSWFFDQWVHRTDIPTYAWDYTVAEHKNENGQYSMTVTVQQSGVPEGFKMPVPIEVSFGGDQKGQVSVVVSKPEETFTLNLPKRPKKVRFNPDYSVLAHVKKL